MTNILEVENLVKMYGDFAAVDGVSFEMEEGEVFGFLGPNGAGKTTTISMLTGITEPTEGTARIAGFDIKTQLDEAKKINGLVPQDLALYPTISARANLRFFGRIYGLHGKDLDERVEDVLRIVALTDRADEPIEKYSGGMKRRINIAAGMVHQPRLLFLDEPTVGVDPQSRNHIFESVLRLNRERGMSILYTSHYMDEVERLCTRVAIVDQGKIIAMDTVENLIAILGGGVVVIGVDKVDDQMLADLSALPAVHNATVAPTVVAPIPTQGEEPKELDELPVFPLVKVETEDSRDALVNIFTYLSDKDISVRSLEVLESNLENVFLHLTGKKLRE
jgi:ABC-2 type transport system ATP-binding protein